MAKQTLRIPIPTTTSELIKLGKAIHKKHVADGAASPLKAMEDYSWDAVAADLTAAEALHTQAEEHRKKAEELYRERDAKIPNVKGAITSSRNILKGIHAKNPKKLGDYGFTVDDTPKAKKVAAPSNG